MSKAKRTAWLAIGLPHSGQKEFLEELSNKQRGNIRVISIPEIVKNIYGSKTSKAKWDKVKIYIEEELEMAYLKSELVFIEHTFCKASERKSFCVTLLKYGFEDIQGVVFKADISKILEENEKDEDPYTQEQLENLLSRFERDAPSLEEGFSTLISN